MHATGLTIQQVITKCDYGLLDHKGNLDHHTTFISWASAFDPVSGI